MNGYSFLITDRNDDFSRPVPRRSDINSPRAVLGLAWAVPSLRYVKFPLREIHGTTPRSPKEPKCNTMYLIDEL
jgi:hypothetical protein